MRRIFNFSLMFTVLFLSISVFTSDCRAGSDEASFFIERAESVVVSSYHAVLEAESAGANVSKLLVRLNEAGDLLSQARVSYMVGGFDEAVRLAELSMMIGESVETDALGVKDLAIEEASHRLWWTVIGSIVGVVVVAFLSFLGWLIFKGRYYRRVLGMRPEAVSNGS